jgi:hypothetical protein
LKRTSAGSLIRMKQLLNIYLIAKRTTKPITTNLPSPPFRSDLTKIALAADDKLKARSR